MNILRGNLATTRGGAAPTSEHRRMLLLCLSAMLALPLAVPSTRAEGGHSEGLPAFHSRPQKPLHRVLPRGQFSDPRLQAVYAMAASVRSVLY